jgi:hypothetical protein
MCDVIHVDTVKEKLEKQVKRIEELETKVNIMEVLAEERRQFIVNGVELGYISLPDCEVDSANDTFARCNLENEYALNNFKLEQQIGAIGDAQEFACSNEFHEQNGGNLSTMQLINVYYARKVGDLKKLKERDL